MQRGLSPLARGTLTQSPRITSLQRFIPAGAGNSDASTIAHQWWPVYPRWRGELRAAVLRLAIHRGLSPLARGTLQNCINQLPEQRFIPAGAGNSPTACMLSHARSVYPRWRGELTSASYGGLCEGGLSPLARGTRTPVAQTVDRWRFIPAGAGNSCVTPSRGS